MTRNRNLAVGLGAVVLLAVAGSGGAQETAGPSPERLRTVETLRRNMEAPRHPRDGGGRAWLELAEGQSASIQAATAGRWSILYEAGGLGIEDGGSILLYVPTAWQWSPPQTASRERPGFVEVTLAETVSELAAPTLTVAVHGAKMYVRVGIEGRALQKGERVRMVYGAGPAGALSDRFAERGSRFWIGVDGDGDGVSKLLPDSPAVDVTAGPPALLVLSVPATARPGETARLCAAVLDASGNAGAAFQGELKLLPIEGLALPESLVLEAADAGRKSAAFEVVEPGVYRLRAEGPGGAVAESNPLVVEPDGPRILWGDLQGHSAHSDGTGTPEDYFLYARDIAALDVVSLTDHDHWGRPFLDQRPAAWAEIVEQTRRFHRPERFVALLGYEWTSWVYGHRHVLYLGDTGELLSNLDRRFGDPRALWQGLEAQGTRALTVPHHPGGGPIEIDWNISPDARFEPVVEMVSIHGSSEAPDSPGLIYKPVAGSFARDALDRGYRLGFIGSGDSHDGHPGFSHIASRSGGLAGIFSEELTREGVAGALRARQTYATNGVRLYLEATLDGEPMGSVLPAGAGERKLALRIVSPGPLARIDLVQDGAVASSHACQGERELRREETVTGLVPGGYLYVRILQQDGGAAWSSPFFFE